MTFTHMNEAGYGRMVNVTDKKSTHRIAIAQGKIRMQKKTLDAVKNGAIQKGDVLQVAQIAGVMGAKQTDRLIPLCHPLPLTGVDLAFHFDEDGIVVRSAVQTEGKTGVEMEALTAVSTALLTIYDMTKAIDKSMVIGEISLLYKEGGKSGVYEKKQARVVSINRSAKKGVVKNPIEEGIFIENFGLEEDAHSGPWHRQVSLLAIESYDKMKNQEGDRLPIGSFAENITTEGILLYELPVGTILRIGETLHEVTQIGKECHSGCQIKQTVGKCVMPLEGIFTKVLKGGTIKEGDLITLLQERR